MTYFLMYIFFSIYIIIKCIYYINIYYFIFYKIKYLNNLLKITESKINNLNNKIVIVFNEIEKNKKYYKDIHNEFINYKFLYHKEKEINNMELNNLKNKLEHYKKQIDNIEIIPSQNIEII